MNCKKCNGELGAEEKFCAKCGQEVSVEVVPDLKKKTKLRYPFNNVRSIVSFVLIIAAGTFLFNTIHSPVKKTQSNTDYITQGVAQAKAGLTLPSKVDNYTTILDITAQPNAVRYEYLLSNIDTSKISNDLLRSILNKSICTDDKLMGILDRGINMEYSYKVENSTQTYFVTFSKADCAK